MQDEDHPRDWADLRHEANAGGFGVHLGHHCGICVDKDSEIQVAYRKRKGRVINLGNAVIDQYHDDRTFRDMGSLHSTLEDAIAIHFNGCLREHATEIADADQAYGSTLFRKSLGTIGQNMCTGRGRFVPVSIIKNLVVA